MFLNYDIQFTHNFYSGHPSQPTPDPIGGPPLVKVTSSPDFVIQYNKPFLNSLICNNMKRATKFRLVGAFFYILAIAMVSTVAIWYASGYRYDFSRHKYYKVSVISFGSDSALNILHVGDDPNLKLYINGEMYEDQMPQAVYLEPGRYTVEIRKSGYHTFSETIDLSSGQLYDLRDLVMFKDNIQPVVTKVTTKPQDLVNSSLVNGNVYVLYGHEIRANGNLVTRLSDPVLNAIAYNKNYIVYQTDKSINLIMNDGSNNTELFKTDTTSTLHLSVTNRGRTIEARDSVHLLSADIR